jgi:hypothetical protein
MSGLPQTDHALPIDSERVFNDPAVTALIDHKAER